MKIIRLAVTMVADHNFVVHKRYILHEIKGITQMKGIKYIQKGG